MKKIFFLCLMILAGFAALAKDIKFPVADIPPSLLKNANVVKRMDDNVFRIINAGEAVLRRRFALTILNENGAPHAVLEEYYDRLQQVKSIEGALYDANGVLVKKLKQKDILDLSAVDNNNLMDDSRKKQHGFYYRSYPYTIEYEVEIKYNNTLFYPGWMPQEDECFAVAHSSFVIDAPPGYEVRHRSFNYPGPVDSAVVKNRTVRRWEVNNLEQRDKPFASPPWRELTTAVFFAPSQFEVHGYKGSMDTWHQFGKFIYSLKNDRDKLPDDVIAKVNGLTAGAKSEEEKVTLLYRYLQQHTRYVSIQLGLGGWQPFEASYVAKKGYGDCKALTNYMSALLKQAGIRSCYTLVRAGENSPAILEDFPSQQFNHVILCVPLASDTIWLECTSQYLPAGYLGDFTANRTALVVDEHGGVLVKTPGYGVDENIQERRITAKLQENGSMDLAVNTKYQALMSDELQMLSNTPNLEQVKNSLDRRLAIPGYKVKSFFYDKAGGPLPVINEKLELAVNGYATVSGKRIFILPNILNRSQEKNFADDKRTAGFVFDRGFREEDHYEMEIPAGYEIESLPPDLQLSASFGRYSSTARMKNNTLIYIRKREQFPGKYPVTDLLSVNKFYEDMYKGDRLMVVLVRK